jgi:hypothetical protein
MPASHKAACPGAMNRRDHDVHLIRLLTDSREVEEVVLETPGSRLLDVQTFIFKAAPNLILLLLNTFHKNRQAVGPFQASKRFL